MSDRGLTVPTGWRIDRRTFLKALGLSGAGIVGGALGARLAPFVAPVAAQSSLIEDLALELQFDRERIFRFVADQIRYQPYAGLLRGPAGTLMAHAGNSVDQAALLAALLGAAGIQSRFALGPLDTNAAAVVLDSAASDAETLRREIGEAVTGRAMGARPLVVREPDPTQRLLLDEAVAKADVVVSWARSQLTETTSIIDEALRQAGIVVPAGTSPLPASERDAHLWVQAASGPSWLDLDPSLPGALPGDAAAPATSTLSEMPDDWRHRLAFSVVSEVLSGGELSQATLLEAGGFADVLSGVPIGVLNVERDGLKGLGANITAGLEGGTTYLPSLILGDEVVIGPGALTFGGDSSGGPFGDLAAGTPGSGDGEPTAEWVQVTISSPDAEPVVVRREIFDRLGPAARATGATGIGSLGPAELVELDADSPRDYMPAQRTHWLTVNTGIVGGEELGRRLQPSGMTQALSALVDTYHVLREASGLELALPLGVGTFVDGPNLVSVTVDQEIATDGALRVRPALDIWHRSVGTVPVSDGASPVSPALMTGVIAHVAERLFFGDADVRPGGTAASMSVGAVFDAAREAGMGFRVVKSRADLTDLPLPPDALTRLSQSLVPGMVAIVPERPVTIGGDERVGWWIVDAATGHIRDEADDGRGLMGEKGAIVKADVEALPPFRRLGNCAAMVFFIAAPVIIGGVMASSDDPVASWAGAAIAVGQLAQQAAAQWGLPPDVAPPGLFGC